jgi:hypothetical protein
MAGRLFLWDEKNGLDLSNAVIASASGYCETTETWLTVLTGHHGARYACPTRHYRRWGNGLLDHQARRLARDAGTAPCRMHFIANVLDTLPYPAQIPGKRAYTR